MEADHVQHRAAAAAQVLITNCPTMQQHGSSAPSDILS
jgi:hypothetical protein